MSRKPSPAHHYSRNSIRASAFLFAVCLLLYANTISNQFAFDDNGLILENRFFIEGSSVREIFTTNYRFGANTPGDGLYRPLAMFSYYLNFLASGLNPASFHIFNSILHAFVTVLLFLLLSQLTGVFLLSLAASLLFAVHPLHTEAVANIAGRPELLYTGFLLAAWLVLEKNNRLAAAYPIAALFLLCALLSKETAAVFPFLVFTVDYIRNTIPLKRMLARFGILMFVVLLYLAIRWTILGETLTGSVPRYYDNPLYFMDPFPRAMNALMVLGNYLGLLLLPWRLLSDYSFRTLPVISGVSIFFSIGMFVVLVVCSYFAFMKRKQAPAIAFGAAMFFYPWFLISNLVLPVGTIMGERLMYFSSAGIMLVLASVLLWLYSRQRGAAIVVMVALVLFYSVQTVARNRDWLNDRTITSRDFLKAPENIKLMANMGYWEKQDGNTAQAEQYYRSAIDIYPEFAEGLNGLGKIAYDRGDLETACQYYRKSSENAPRDIIIQFNYTSVLIKLKQFEEAEKVLGNTLRRDPRAFILYRSLGNLRLAQFRFEDAIEYFEKALVMGDNRQICYNNLAASAFYGEKYNLAWEYVNQAMAEHVMLDRELIRSIQTKMSQ